MEEQQRKEKDSHFQMKFEMWQDCNQVCNQGMEAWTDCQQHGVGAKEGEDDVPGNVHSEDYLLSDEGSATWESGLTSGCGEAIQLDSFFLQIEEKPVPKQGFRTSQKTAQFDIENEVLEPMKVKSGVLKQERDQYQVWLNSGAQTHEQRRWDEQESESTLKRKLSEVNTVHYHDYKFVEE
ncbi:hypothetical protein llap_2730 [Limosa lapponica baueri]|uniref:Uncharacterized protein n=1 Tax=Limosa lapponica baueri TaxID=1758121 RepID=A0A2I0ULM7_LIMLA|nr:hypothetical protein llap_2730 [Limosa lapponica baueri]